MNFIALHFQVGLDSRSVMREAYALFKDGGDPEKVVSFEDKWTYLACAYKFLRNIYATFLFHLQLASNFSSGSEGESFYSSLYTGLYYESQVQLNHKPFLWTFAFLLGYLHIFS